jgi:hypothetical protein
LKPTVEPAKHEESADPLDDLSENVCANEAGGQLNDPDKDLDAKPTTFLDASPSTFDLNPASKNT